MTVPEIDFHQVRLDPDQEGGPEWRADARELDKEYRERRATDWLGEGPAPEPLSCAERIAAIAMIPAITEGIEKFHNACAGFSQGEVRR